LTVAIKHKVYLYTLTVYSAIVLRRLGYIQLLDHTELSIRSTTLSTMYPYLNSLKFVLNAVLHTITYLYIRSIFRGETIEIRIYLKAISSIIGRIGIGSLLLYLQQFISYCNIFSLVLSLSPTVFDFQCLSTEII